MNARWTIKDVNLEVAKEFSRIFGVNEYISSILNAKGIQNPIEAHLFLYPQISNLFSPFYMKGMNEAVARIRKAVDGNERIGIFSDSDVDGLTSLAVVLNLFKRLNADLYYRYTVNDEEYGLTVEVVEEMKGKGVDLLITLDSGIRDVSEIDLAGRLGIDVIICDHHQPGEVIPDAIIVNPKQEGCGYPYKELAGVGVAFKLCHGILISYLQSFNKPFLLIAQDDDDKIWLSRIMNGVFEEVWHLDDIHQLRDSCAALNKDVNIVLFDTPGMSNELRDIFKEYKVYGLIDLVKRITGPFEINSNANLDELCKFFSINGDIPDRKIDVVNLIFSAVEFNNSHKINEFIDSTIELVALGTIADIMPVIGENRTLIHYGIKSLNSTKHPGLSFIMRGIKRITSKSIAWQVAPLLNSPGRFGKTELTAKFLIESDRKILEDVLDNIKKLNSERKNLVSEIYEKTMRDIKNGEVDISGNILFLKVDIPEGLSGIVANRLAESLNKPVIITSKSRKNEYAKGSGRVIGNFNFLSFVEPLSHLFIRIGGHKQAFGFTAEIGKLDEISKQIQLAVGDEYKVEKELQIDLEIPVGKIDVDFIHSLSVFEPHGYKNEELIFLSRGVEVLDFRRIGKDKNHGIFVLNSDTPVEAVGWKMAEPMEEFFKKGHIDLVYNLEINEFNGRISPRMVILDMR